MRNVYCLLFLDAAAAWQRYVGPATMLVDVPAARGLRFQDDNFSVSDLTGQRLDKLYGLENGSFWIVLLKPDRLPWQRFFLDAGLGFWGEWEEADVIDDLHGTGVVDLAARFSVVGAKILGASCSPPPRIELTLSVGLLVLDQEDSTELDGSSRIQFFPH